MLDILGAWIQSTGTTVAAIGETIIVKGDDEESAKKGLTLVALGNGIEATGNSLQAVAREKILQPSEGKTLGIFGTWLQAAGNITNVVAANQLIQGMEEGLRLDILGDIFQSFGAASEAVAYTLEEETPYTPLLIGGNTFLSIGAFLEAVGEIYILNDQVELGDQLVAFGSYVETAGATIAALGLTKNFEVEQGIRPTPLTFNEAYSNKKYPSKIKLLMGIESILILILE
ncbi:hypothetical protein Q73_02005 [Bacillus coahuilensis m2-6]|nr:hypothetical protein Q73_02005 [Bacillus coahuilensis m2-6]